MRDYLFQRKLAADVFARLIDGVRLGDDADLRGRHHDRRPQLLAGGHPQSDPYRLSGLPPSVWRPGLPRGGPRRPGCSGGQRRGPWSTTSWCMLPRAAVVRRRRPGGAGGSPLALASAPAPASLGAATSPRGRRRRG